MDYEEKDLKQLIASVKDLNLAAMETARKRQAQLAKPPGSLGKLEDLSVQIAGITAKVCNRIQKKRVLVFAADNGVVSEDVSSAPQSVTLSQTVNLTLGKTGAAVLCRHFGNELVVCDVGVNAKISAPAVLNRKIDFGTSNIAKGAAMSREQAIRAILTGAELAVAAANDAVQAIGVGEMGIGNTTTSSAVLAVLTKSDIRDVTGRGGGITEKSYQKKLEVIQKSIAINQPNPNDVVDILSKVGGFDIAAMTGAFIGAAVKRIPVVIDGFISAVAALCAVRLSPKVRGYLVASHASYEIGYQIAIEAINIQPMFMLGMRLGEGSGCPLAFEVLDAACSVLNEMATFEDAKIDDSYLSAIRKEDSFTVKRRK